MKWATITSEDYDPSPSEPFNGSTERRDVIAILRNAIRAVCANNFIIDHLFNIFNRFVHHLYAVMALRKCAKA